MVHGQTSGGQAGPGAPDQRFPLRGQQPTGYPGLSSTGMTRLRAPLQRTPGRPTSEPPREPTLQDREMYDMMQEMLRQNLTLTQQLLQNNYVNQKDFHVMPDFLKTIRNFEWREWSSRGQIVA